MALTEAQMTDVRRYAGYALAGTTQPISVSFDTMFMRFGTRSMSLYERLTTLSASEESVLTTNYLANLATLEAAIPASTQNLDTKKASVWEWNDNEISDRIALFNRMRQAMCAFIGCDPGPGLNAIGSGGMAMVRA